MTQLHLLFKSCLLLFCCVWGQMQQKVMMGRKVHLSPEPFIGGGCLRFD